MIPPTIAIVHGDATVTSLLVSLLEEEGYYPLTFPDPRTTEKEDIWMSRADLAIIDLGLGTNSPGSVLVNELRSDDRTAHISIIALTTAPDPEEIRPENCRENCEMLQAPFDINNVLGLIRSLLKSPQHSQCC